MSKNETNDITLASIITERVKDSVHSLMAKVSKVRRVVYMALRGNKRDIMFSESFAVSATSMKSLRRLNAMLTVLRGQRGRMATSDKTISQINAVLHYVDIRAASFNPDSPDHVAFFLEHVVNVTYLITNQRIMKVWIEVVTRDKLETKRAFFIQDLEDPNLSETISIAF